MIYTERKLKERCQAVFDDEAHATTWNVRPRIRMRPRKRCARKGKYQVGHLHLCAAHARLCRQGFMDEHGAVDSVPTIRERRRHFRKFPNPNHSWLQDADPENR